ncbi:hypothetical protein BKA70DRAFT_1313785, partial [Coprinopsis sp. MPI-PUGE-AT-0042]
CMLVCRSFAHEFRRHLFESLYICDSVSENTDDISKRLCVHAKALQDHPEYQTFVKTVKIDLLTGPGLGPSIFENPQFPSWLKGLTSVTSFSLRRFTERFDFAVLESRPRDAIVKLCSLPSIRRMMFDRVDNLPPQLFCDRPSLEYLSLASVTIDGSLAQGELGQLIEQARETSTFRGPQIHLDIPRHRAGEDIRRILRSLLPITNRVWKLSGRYDTINEAALLVTSALFAKERLRELSLTFSNMYGQLDNEPLNMAPILISPAKNLERLTLKFVRFVSNAPPFHEPSLGALLGHITSMFSLIKQNDHRSLPRLSIVSIEMHHVPSQCLLDEGMEQDRAMWEGLGDVLSNKGYLPGLKRLELALFLRRGEIMSEEEIHSSVSPLLPSLAPDARVITISSARSL